MLNLEKYFEIVTTRLQFSKLLLIHLFSHKILIFFKKNLGGPNLLLDPPVLFWGVHGPPGPPGSGPHGNGNIDSGAAIFDIYNSNCSIHYKVS